MGKGKSRGGPRYTHQSAYRSYAREVSSAVPFPQYDAFLRSLFKKLSRTIIVDRYEWRIPFRGGYLRIAKNAKGFFYWYWDRLNTYCLLRFKRYWAFQESRGRGEEMVGYVGLTRHYMECRDDPYRENYDVPRRIYHGNLIRE